MGYGRGGQIVVPAAERIPNPFLFIDFGPGSAARGPIN